MIIVYVVGLNFGSVPFFCFKIVCLCKKNADKGEKF
jgi:hypothetical protein